MKVFQNLGKALNMDIISDSHSQQDAATKGDKVSLLLRLTIQDFIF